MNWNELQAAHKVWVDREYPNQPPEVPAAGVVEEAGELLHAVLKLMQESIWGKEGRYDKLQNDLLDAMGDCALYAVSACNCMGFSMQRVMFGACSIMPQDGTPLSSAVRLVTEGAVFFNVRSEAALAIYMRTLLDVCNAYGVDLGKTTMQVWDALQLRKRSDKMPTVVTLCGSTRFKEEFIAANFRETMKGKIVLSVGFFTHGDKTYECSEEEKLALDQLHFRKIDMSREILVLDCNAPQCENCRCHADDCKCLYNCVIANAPYIGYSTKREIAHAKATGKTIRYLSQEGV